MTIRRTALMTAAASLMLPASLLGHVSAADAATTYSCGGRTATIVGTGHGDIIQGTAGPDVIVAGGGDDHVNGMGGNDYICGNRGGDTLYGDAGNDRVWGGLDRFEDGDRPSLQADSLSGGPGDDYLSGGFDDRLVGYNNPLTDIFDYADAPGPVTVNLAEGVATGWGRDVIAQQPRRQVLGSLFGDTLLSSRLGEGLDGAAGPDLLYGYGGNDRLRGQGGTDRLVGGGGADTLDGGWQADVIDGGIGNDQLFDTGDVGRDRFIGGDGDDTVEDYSSASGESADGGQGRDALTVRYDLSSNAYQMTCTSIELFSPTRACL